MNDWLSVAAWDQILADLAPGWLPLGLPRDPLIVIAACALALAIILARTPSRYLLTRQMVLVGALLAAIGTLAGIGGFFPEAAWTTVAALLVGGVALAGLIGKLLLANRHAGMRDSRYRGAPDSELLPFQARALERLRDQANRSPTPVAIGLQAEWGMGKSFVIDHLIDHLNRDSAFVAVKVNVWEYEDHEDMQYGVMQALLAHPLALARYGWLTYPLWMLARDWGGLRVRRFQLGWNENKLDVDGKLHLPWQSRFERIVARQGAAGRRVAIVLDEIDRAGASATQAALTMVMRSLSLPGVVAVIPYVPKMIAFKAFHPDMIALDDLRDTVATHLEGLLVQSSAGKGADKSAPARKYAYGQSERFQVLAADFMEFAEATDWETYYREMSERYIRYSVHLGRPDGEDLLAILRLPEVEVLFRPFQDRYEELLRWVKDETAKRNPNFVRIDMRVRWLKGDLLKFLSAPIYDHDGLDPRFCVMLALSRGGAELIASE